MPLARVALYGRSVDIHPAPTWDNSDVWVATLRHIAREGRSHVVGITACIRAADLPEGLPGRHCSRGDVLRLIADCTPRAAVAFTRDDDASPGRQAL